MIDNLSSLLYQLSILENGRGTHNRSLSQVQEKCSGGEEKKSSTDCDVAEESPSIKGKYHEHNVLPKVSLSSSTGKVYACLSQCFGQGGCYFGCDKTVYLQLYPYTKFFDTRQLRIS